MLVFMLVVMAVMYLSLVAVTAVEPTRSDLSSFELARRVAQNDPVALRDAEDDAAYADIVSLQRIMSALLLVMLTILALGSFGGWNGAMIALFVVLTYGALARPLVIRQRAQRLYDRHASSIIRFVTTHQRFCRLVRHALPTITSRTSAQSREELEYSIATSGDLLTQEERQLFDHGLHFGERHVQDSMIPRSAVDTVNRNELLGPLALNDLHQTGHSRFPVIDGDIDHVIGMLYIQDLLTLGDKKSLTAQKAMEPKVYYIAETQSLSHALAAFLRTRHHLFIVVNEFRETTGIISLEDVIEALLGRAIVDEFDTHEDLRVVALRHARAAKHETGSRTV